MKIEIFTEGDSHDGCELCGTSYEEGGYVLVDGKEVVRITPFAACYDGEGATEWELLILTLANVGITVRVDGNQPFMTHTANKELLDKIEENLNEN